MVAQRINFTMCFQDDSETRAKFFGIAAVNKHVVPCDRNCLRSADNQQKILLGHMDDFGRSPGEVRDPKVLSPS